MKKIIISILGFFLLTASLIVYLFFNGQNSKEVIIKRSLTKRVESVPHILKDDALTIFCGNGGGVLNAPPKSFQINNSRDGNNIFVKGATIVSINIPSYNCGSNRTHIQKGYKEYKLAYRDITEFYEIIYESGKKEFSPDSYVTWFTVNAKNQDCIYEK